MKQFKLRKEKSFIKILKEPPILKPKVNWSRRFYIGIFMLVIFMFVKRIYNVNMLILANGQLELPKQTVNFPNDIKIIDINVVTGQKVCEGDTLFIYQNMADQLDQARISMRSPKSNDWLIKEQLSLKKNIELNKLMIRQKKKYLLLIKKTIATKESLLLAGLHEEYNQYSDLQSQKSQLLADINYSIEEIKILNRHLRQFQSQINIYNNINIDGLEVYNEIKYFISPLDGVISDVFYEINEICYKKEEMITIHQLINASINTYFDPEEIRYLEIGDIVDVEFPDRSKSKGVISKFFVSTYALPSEFQKKYEPTERNIVAEILPLNKADELAWNSFYKMNVLIEKNRYNFSL